MGMTSVVIGSELYGEVAAVARDVTAGGMLVQTVDVLPMGAVVTVHFRIGVSDDELVARAEVVGVWTPPLGQRGMALRFLDFDDNLPMSLPGDREMQ